MKSAAFIYASEGTGHRVAAEALRDEFLSKNPGAFALCCDILDFIPRFMKAILSEGYLLMARYVPWSWGMVYWSTDKKSWQNSSFDAIHSFLCRIYLPKLEKLLYDSKVEAVFFTHHFGACEFAKRNITKIPTFYVNTDFASHMFQRSIFFKASFAASPKAVKQHHDDGIKSAIDTGIPIASKFSSLLSKTEARKKINIPDNKRLVMVSGGGIGAGDVFSVVASLSHSEDLHIVVICGSNNQLLTKLKRAHFNLENISVKGFVSNIEDYYAASDIAVMKPGGLSVSEALTAELPLVFINPIPGQEELNMEYICSSGAAYALTCGKDALQAVNSLFNDEKKLGNMRDNAKRLSRANAAKVIIEEAQKLV